MLGARGSAGLTTDISRAVYFPVGGWHETHKEQVRTYTSGEGQGGEDKLSEAVTSSWQRVSFGWEGRVLQAEGTASAKTLRLDLFKKQNTGKGEGQAGEVDTHPQAFVGEEPEVQRREVTGP